MDDLEFSEPKFLISSSECVCVCVRVFLSGEGGSSAKKPFATLCMTPRDPSQSLPQHLQTHGEIHCMHRQVAS